MGGFLYLSILISLSSFNSDTTFAKYCNARFNFCIEYPNSFERQSEPENGDGLIFLSRDKSTEIPAFGSLAVEDFDKLDQEYSIAVSDLRVTYKVITKDWFIFSGIDKKGKIVYRKTRKKKIDYMGQGATYVFQTLMITYPQSQNQLYKPYCIKISKDF